MDDEIDIMFLLKYQHNKNPKV